MQIRETNARGGTTERQTERKRDRGRERKSEREREPAHDFPRMRAARDKTNVVTESQDENYAPPSNKEDKEKRKRRRVKVRVHTGISRSMKRHKL